MEKERQVDREGIKKGRRYQAYEGGKKKEKKKEEMEGGLNERSYE